ncbi:hypothetical protein P7K49_021781 [Saguinus oedipus]|uniref:Uncharacterized protein n=1 Tax=Saguinus oedipus TaxID=9490 RepID=A0ABQ9UVD6_SAGOE|nr:hypothetical protein P7K49_021781 [Saguinus oedipus]
MAGPGAVPAPHPLPPPSGRPRPLGPYAWLRLEPGHPVLRPAGPAAVATRAARPPARVSRPASPYPLCWAERATGNAGQRSGGALLMGAVFPHQLPNMFGNLRSTLMSLMIGSYASSAITFPGIKVFQLGAPWKREKAEHDQSGFAFPPGNLIYDAGVAFVVIMFTWSGLACLIFLNCALNWPVEAFPAPEEVNYM